MNTLKTKRVYLRILYLYNQLQVDCLAFRPALWIQPVEVYSLIWS